MADAARGQRKSAAKAARRRPLVAEKKFQVSSASLVGRIQAALMGSIVRCMMPSNLFEIGIGHVVVARALLAGLLGCAFPVDVFCLGVRATSD